MLIFRDEIIFYFLYLFQIFQEKFIGKINVRNKCEENVLNTSRYNNGYVKELNEYFMLEKIEYMALCELFCSRKKNMFIF